MTKAATIKRHGGKNYLAPRIVSLMPPHKRYCEPFFGGGAVLFERSGEGVAEYVNDLDGELTNFWDHLKFHTRFIQFMRMIEGTPFSGTEFDRSKERLARQRMSEYAPFAPGCLDDDLERAVAFFVNNRQSRQALGRDFATPTTRLRRGMNEQVSAWLSAVEGLPAVHARLKRVEIWNKPAVEFIRKLDTADTFFYCDPPYLHETRATTGEYTHEMTAEHHGELLALLATIKGKFILSGYPSQLYDDIARSCGWRVIDIEIDNKASGKKTKEKKIERLWSNY